MSDNPQAALYAALAAAQAEIADPVRSVSGQVRGRKDYRYVNLAGLLAVVRPALAKHGIAVTQLVDVVDGQTVLRSRMLHAGGGMIESVCPLDFSGGPQERGSTLSYFRRYCLEAMVGVAPVEEDDDAASAQRVHDRSTSTSSRPNGAGGARPQVSPPGGGSEVDLERERLIADITAAVPLLPEGVSIDALKAKHSVSKGASVASLRALLADVVAAVPEPGSDLEVA